MQVHRMTIVAPEESENRLRILLQPGEMGASLGTHSARQQITLQPKTKAVDSKPYLPPKHGSKSVGFSEDCQSDDDKKQKERLLGPNGEEWKDRESNSNKAPVKPSQKRHRVTLNVSGFKYQTYGETLQKFPHTLLGDPAKRADYYDRELREYFFDRNKQVFEIILYFYQSNGRLVCPPDLAPEILLEEVEFFELGETAINAVKELLTDEEPEEAPRELPKNKIQRQIWNLFEYPDSGNVARVLALFSVSIIVASIVILCTETLPNFRIIKVDPNDTAEVERVREHNEIASTGRMIFGYLEAVFIAWFTLEYMVRLCTSPRKLNFVRAFLNVIDILAIIPFYIDLLLSHVVENSENLSLAFLRILRLVRVFRIFKLSRHSSGLQILGLTLRKSLRELGLLVFFLLIGIVIFSSMAYYAEAGEPDTHLGRSIPDAFWWALVTMTTVGYGDLVPKTLWGKLVGSCCALCGVLAIALPVPVIVSNFDAIYKKHRSRKIKQSFEDEESKKVNIMVSSASSSSFNEEESGTPTFDRKTDHEKPLWVRRDAEPLSLQQSNGNVSLDQSKNSTKETTPPETMNGNYLTSNPNDYTKNNEDTSNTDIEMAKLDVGDRENSPKFDEIGLLQNTCV